VREHVARGSYGPPEQAVPPHVLTWRRLDAELRRSGIAPYLWNVALLAGLYYGAARIGYEFQFTGPVAGIVWLPVGVATSYLSLRGLRFWPGALLGDVLSNQYSTIALGGAVGQTTGNLIEVLLAAYLLRRLMRTGSPLQSVRGVALMLGAIALGTAASAIIGPCSLIAAGSITAGSFARVARTWWLADACGALIVVPLALAWFSPQAPPRGGSRLKQALLMVVVVGACAWLSTRGASALTYLVFPALVLAAIRFGSRTATVAVLLTAGFAIRATTHYEGPFSYTSITHSVLITQLFIAVAAISTLLVVALVAERELVAEHLHAARLDVLRAEYLERQRIERNLHDGVQQRMLALLAHLKNAERLDDSGDVRQVISTAEVEVRAAMEELRELARGAFPPLLTESGLAVAVTELGARSSLPVAILELPDVRFDIATEAAAYFVVAEALTNAQRHADATVAAVGITAAGDVVDVVVADDGVGGAHESGASGLRGLRERVESVGGTFDIDSPRGEGTRITAVIPVVAGG
jgi:signal transduction histidine kinase